MKRAWIWALLIAMAGAGWFGLGQWRAQQQAPAPQPEAQEQEARKPELFAVEVITAAEEDYRPVLKLAAHAEPWRVAVARARAAGEVVEAPVPEGAMVKAGDVLCRLDDAGSSAELEAAKAALASAERDYRAAQRLRRSGTMADAQFRRAEAQLKAARARLEQARLAVKWRVIPAPVDGVVQRQVAKVGDVLSAGAACAELVVLDPLKVVAHATEREVARLRQGQKVRARFTSGIGLDGTLHYIAPSGDAATRTFQLEARMDNPQLRARGGMTAVLHVPLEAMRVARVPLSALLLADDGRLGVHIVDAAGVVRFRALRIVREERDGVLVQGLKKGEQVIVSGQHFVKPGQKVRAVPKGALLPLPSAHKRQGEQPT